MAITRRQFVTRLGALAAAAGMSQGQISKLTEALALGDYGNAGTNWNSPSGKPTVVWVHGAECTGCSTSLLGLFEDVTGTAIEGTTTSTLAALDLAVGGDGTGAEIVPDYRTLYANGLNVDGGALGTGTANAGLPAPFDTLGEDALVANIQDVLLDFIELDYHETVMNMGGDLAYQWLKEFMAQIGTYEDSSGNPRPFVLVVEGAVQKKSNVGAWNDASGTAIPWCSIGVDASGTAVGEHSFDDVVDTLARAATVVIPIGQCATFGGYPGCKPPIDNDLAGFDASLAQTGAQGVYDFLYSFGDGSPQRNACAKVINVPGCPTNPWWFILTVVAVLADLEGAGLGVLSGGAPNPAAMDSTQRLLITYPTTIHGAYCPRFNDWSIGKFAKKPGDPGCLQKIGCKGPAVKSLCGAHGWNAQQPHNDPTWEYDLATANEIATNPGNYRGGHCTRAGHPCMGCTEKGYPDSFVPFVSW